MSCQHKVRAGAEDQGTTQIAGLLHKLEYNTEPETNDEENLPLVCGRLETSYSYVATEMYELFYKLCEQLRISIANMKNQPLLPAYPESKHGSESFEVSRSAGLITRKEQDEAVLNTIIQLKNLFEATITLCAEEFHCSEEEVIARVKKTSARHNQLKKYISDCEATDDLKEDRSAKF